MSGVGFGCKVLGLRSLGAAESLGRLLRLLNASTTMCFPLITPASKKCFSLGARQVSRQG